MNIYNTQSTMSSYSNINGDVNSSEYQLNYKKNNSNPGIGRLYLRKNNLEKELFFKENNIMNYIKNKKKSRKSLRDRLKNLTKKSRKKNKKKTKKKKKKKKKKKNKKKKKKKK